MCTPFKNEDLGHPTRLYTLINCWLKERGAWKFSGKKRKYKTELQHGDHLEK